MEIHGNGFEKGTRVWFGDDLAATVEVVSDSLLRVTTPRGRRGTVDVTLKRQGRTIAIAPDAYQFEGGIPLFVDHVSPERLPEAGGWVTLVGAGFTHDMTVSVDGSEARDLSLQSDQVARVLVPAGSGLADLVLDAPDVDPLVLTDFLQLEDYRLGIDQITPASTSASGGDVVTVTGRDFTPATTVWFGDRPAQRVSWLSERELEVTVPAAYPGEVDLRLSAPGRDDVILPRAFTLTADGDVVIEQVWPSSVDRAGAELVVDGVGFTPGARVWFGDREAIALPDSSRRMRVLAPPAWEAGAPDMRVVFPDGTERVMPAAVTFGAPIQLPAPPVVDAGLAEEGVKGPYLATAQASTATTVVLSFSEPMDATSAREKTNYLIYGDATSCARLEVRDVTVSPDARSVTLTTFSQSPIGYTVIVGNVVSNADKAPLAREAFVTYNSATFVGRPENGVPADEDRDGLSSADEQIGIDIIVETISGDLHPVCMSSNPESSDTDGDLLSDSDEYKYQSDPRQRDTDWDGLTDKLEADLWTDPSKQDTDGDQLLDGDEVSVFITTPTIADSDGDGYDDWEEIFVRNRLPRVADLPRPTITIGQLDLALDVRWSYVDSTGQSRTESSTVESSTQNSVDSTATSSASHTIEANVGVEYGASATLSATPEATVDFKATAGIGYSGTFASEDSETRSSSTASNIADSRESTFDTSSDVTRETVGARVAVDITFGTASDVAFTMKNIELSLMRRDPLDRSKRTPVATLVPATDLSLNLGPGAPLRGPFVFENREVYPAAVEELLKDPNGLIVEIANYDIVDEGGRNLAFVSQDVVERTAEITIDYGDGTTEVWAVAANNGWDAATRKPIGLTIEDCLKAIGLAKDPSTTALAAGAVAPAGASSTFATVGDQLYRVRRSWNASVPVSTAGLADVSNTCRRPPAVAAASSMSKRVRNESLTQWRVLYNDDTGTAAGKFKELRVVPGGAYLLAYTQDRDGDGLFAIEEKLHKSSDTDVDTDDDCLSDFEEIRGERLKLPLTYTTVDGVREPVTETSSFVTDKRPSAGRGVSRPNSADSDGDCLSDAFEVSMLSATTPPPTVLSAWPWSIRQGLDPLSADTDRDGLSDFEEVAGWRSAPYFLSDLAPANAGRVSLVSARDAGAATGRTLAVTYQGGLTQFWASAGASLTSTSRLCPFDLNPTGATVDFVSVTTNLSSPGSAEVQYRTSPWDSDTDDDGLADSREAMLKTNPNLRDVDAITDADGDGLVKREERVCNAAVNPDNDADSDNDGLPDLIERRSVAEGGLGSDPCLADSDNDGLSDLREWDGVLGPILADECASYGGCTLPGRPADSTATSLITRDTDGDGLSDGEEVAGWVVNVFTTGGAIGSSRLVQSDPLKRDTDGDRVSDQFEKAGGLIGPIAVPGGTDPRAIDTDGDGTSDFGEYALADGQGRPALTERCEPLFRDPRRPDVVLEVSVHSFLTLDGPNWRGNDGGYYQTVDLQASLTGTYPGGFSPVAFGEDEDFFLVERRTNCQDARGGTGNKDRNFLPPTNPAGQAGVLTAFLVGKRFEAGGDRRHYVRRVVPVGSRAIVSGYAYFFERTEEETCLDAEWNNLWSFGGAGTALEFEVSASGTSDGEYRTISSTPSSIHARDATSTPQASMSFLFKKHTSSILPEIPSYYIACGQTRTLPTSFGAL